MSETFARRPLLPIRLIALDIDGTLIGDDLVIGPRTRAAVREALAMDVSVSLVTGRMVSSAMRFARELGLTAPVVGYQGGLIREMPGRGSDRLGRLLSHSPLPADVARDIVTWTMANGLDPHVNHLERFILRTNDPNAGFHPSIATETLFIELPTPGQTHVEIVSAEGRLVRSRLPLSGAVAIDDLKAGLYLLRLIDAYGRMRLGRFVKQ